MKQNLADLLKRDPHRLRVLKIAVARTRCFVLTMRVVVDDCRQGMPHVVDIICTNAVDYSIRPPNPATLEGGPLIEYREQHPLIETCGQFIPGGDGEEFDPPLKFGALLLDQSYVIAEKFEILHLSPPPQEARRNP